MTMKPSFRTDSLLALILATALVVALGLELRTTRADYSDFAARSHILRPGMYVPRLELPLLNGQPAVIGSNESGQCELLLVYNTTCEFCRASVPIWNAIATRSRGSDGVQVYGVSLDSIELTRAYAGAHELSYPTAVLLDDRSRSLLRASAVPQTLLITSTGQVLFSRPGLPTEAAVDSLWRLVNGSAADGGPRCPGRVAAD